jgi:hypothetical protein
MIDPPELLMPISVVFLVLMFRTPELVALWQKD